MYGPSKSMQDYQAEDDFRTLQRAEEVKSDKTRHANALQHGKQVVQQTRKVLARGQRISSAEDPSMKNGYRSL